MYGLGKATGGVSLLVTSEVETELISHAVMSLHPLDLYLKFFLLCMSSFHSLSCVSEQGCGQLRPAVLLVPPLMVHFTLSRMLPFDFSSLCSALNALEASNLHKCKSNSKIPETISV